MIADNALARGIDDGIQTVVMAVNVSCPRVQQPGCGEEKKRQRDVNKEMSDIKIFTSVKREKNWINIDV